MTRFNKNIQLFNIYMDSCRAKNKGGGLSIDDNNNDIIISNVTIINSKAQYGAGIYINNQNFNVIFTNVNIRKCSAGFNGGGIAILNKNRNTVFNNVKIIYCYATYDGGGIILNGINEKTIINNVFISYCSVRTTGIPSSSSGGISISNDQELILSNSMIAHCHSNDGGGKNTCYDSAVIYIYIHSNSFIDEH